MLSESATLILSTASTVGSPIVDASFSNITFRNVDLKQTLGEMWEKYDKFIIKPVGITLIGTITLGLSVNSIPTYNMAGLDWININYEMAPGQQRWVPICSLGTLSSGSNTINFPYPNNGWGYNFRKGQQYVDLQFIITVPGQLNMAPPTAVYTNVDMHFVIEPCIEGKMNEIAFFGFCTDTALNVPGRFVDSTRKIYNYPSYDMRRQCSEFWHLHEDFEIMHSWQILRGVGSIANDNRLSPMQISGLNFVNNYTKQGNNTATQAGNYSTDNAILGTTQMTNSGSGHGMQFLPFAPIQFKKQSDNVNLTLTFKNYDNTTLAVPTFTAPQPFFMYGFYIRPTYGVDKATLNINPWGLTTTETNLGVRDTYYTTFTLKNIDMRMVCRSMWNKYNKFNIFLTSTAATVATGNTNNAAILLQMEGFNFANQTAWISNSGQSQTAVLGAIYNSSSGTEPRVFGNQSSHGTMFYKTKDLVDIKLTALPLNPATPFSIAMNPLAANYTFTIVGVEE